VNFGGVNVCPSGKTTPSPCSETLTLTYNVTASGRLGTPLALTTGAADLDYRLASGSTCSGSVVKGNTCSVNVTFAPIAPGAREGAVEIVDGSGNTLATTYIYGTGIGPAVAFSPGALIRLGSGLSGPQGVAVDAGGNIFVADTFHSKVKEILAAGGYTKALNLGGYLFFEPGGVAVDGAGNVFVADTGNYAVKEILKAGGYATVDILASGFDLPEGVAVDGSGNVFVGDTGNGAVKEILAAGGYTTVKTLGSGIVAPEGVALDGSGNVFVADAGSFKVKEITAASGYTLVESLGGSFYEPSSVAVDASGNVYVTNPCCEISEIVAAGGYTTVNTLSEVFDGPNGIAVDASGNLYVGGGYEGTSSIAEFPLSQPPSLAFGSTDLGVGTGQLSTTVQNIGNANLAGTSITVSPNWELVKGSGAPEDCTTSFTLVPGAECNVSISFRPFDTGSLTGAALVTDNALNAPAATQSIPLSGTGVNPDSPEITSLNTTYGAPYSVIYVNGSNFGAATTSNVVKFNGVAAPVYYSTSTFILTTVPGSAATGNVVVTVDGKSSNAVGFTVLPMPEVTGISPTSGPAGTVVTISGTNLLDYENKGSVTFDGKLLSILSQSSAAIKVAVPAGAATGEFHVLVNDTGINTSTFTVTR